jgi:HD-like signal output (HDOD) protein
VLILVVSEDGEAAARAGRELADQGLDWEIAWTDRPETALAGDRVPDVLVCGNRIGASGGVGLLGLLRQRHPEAMRILLMDSGEESDAMNALEVTQRVLPAPLDSIALIEAVESACELRAMLDDPELKRVIGRVGSLPAAPNQYLALTRLLRDPDVAASQVAEVVSKDPAVAAQVLRMTNSAYYTTGREITDVRTAVTRLGSNVLRRLVLASEVFAGGGNASKANAMRDRALRISRLAGQLLAGPSAELAATAGLLAEVGLLLPLAKTDEGRGATPHNVAGAYLLGLWGLPSPIVEAVAFHTTPSKIRGFWVTGAVHVATCLVNETPPDEGYLRKTGQFEQLPRWRALASSLAEAA